MTDLIDPLKINAVPEISGPLEQYREGKLKVLTFENENSHMCYGVDTNGDVWDFCFIGHAPLKFVHLEDRLSEEEIAEAKALAVEFEITQ